MRRFKLKKLSELKAGKEKQIKISNRFAALESTNDRKDIKNRAWEKIKENFQTSVKESLGLHEWKQHKPWLDKECA
jgi:benzoyl-CoA reductase/2-hydroxyglutaryl-CoA dehydratase subunit BcrC/BadD/HgdB